jgi:hypothetical protein
MDEPVTVVRMKATLNIDDGILRRAKQVAAERGTTLTRVVEDALRAALDDLRDDGSSYELDIKTIRGRRVPSVDPADRDALYEFLERSS